MSPCELKEMTRFFLFFFLLFLGAGSCQPNSDGSPATGGTSLHLTSYYTLHEMTASLHLHTFLQMLSQL